jgi:hypothetical protein
MKRVISSIIFLLIVSLIIAACNETKIKDIPEINVQFRVSDLTDKEFESVGTNGLENPTKDDFKKIEFTLDVKQSNKILNRKITIPAISRVANSYDRVRYWFGSTYSQDNTQENFAKYGDKFLLYSKGLDEQGIKNIFKSAEVKVSWTLKGDGNEERAYKLGDIVQFE